MSNYSNRHVLTRLRGLDDTDLHLLVHGTGVSEYLGAYRELSPRLRASGFVDDNGCRSRLGGVVAGWSKRRCAWCGCECVRPWSSRAFDLFCSKAHRTACSNSIRGHRFADEYIEKHFTEEQRTEAAEKPYPCPHCKQRQTYAEAGGPDVEHYCRRCRRRIIWYSELGTLRYGWDRMRMGDLAPGECPNPWHLFDPKIRTPNCPAGCA